MFAGRYRLEQCLGAGGFGEVWSALDTVTSSNVAVKIHLKGNDERAAKEIVKEYTRVRDIHHDNLLTPTYVGIADGHVPYLVMELCEGDLTERDLTEDEVWHLIRDVAAGLGRLAGNKKKRTRSDGTVAEVSDPIIHQDIKPANILLRSNGMYAISDFGISKRRLSTLSTNYQDAQQEMDSAMTIDYAAPERFPRGKGVAVLASDIWSLGAMLFEIVEGHRPFAECGGDCLNPTIGLTVPAISREGYSDELKQLIYDCMAKEPEKRPTAAQLQAYAEEVIQGRPRTKPWAQGAAAKKQKAAKPKREKPAEPKAKQEKEPKPDNKKLKTAAMVIVPTLAALIVLFAWLIRRNGPTPDTLVGHTAESVENDYPVAEEPTTTTPSQQTVTPQPTTPSRTPSSAAVRMDGNTLKFTVDGQEYSYQMIYVGGGTFTMGCTSEQGSDCWSAEQPAHSVTVSSFYMGQTEVTQALWKAVMGNNPSNWKGNNLPVEQVSYNDCIEFINKLNQLTGRTFRLPTEEEWEFAARGGNKSQGYKYSGSNDIGTVAWYYGNSGSKTHPVAQKQRNELGLYDMSGNVWEWCSSIWCSDYNSSRSGSYHVYRGGSWNYYARYCRVSFRYYDSPGDRPSSLGFRLASGK